MKNDRIIKRSTIMVCLLVAMLMTGCASEYGYFAGRDLLGTPGFFGGLFHGIITPLVFFPWIISKALWAIGGFSIGYWANEFQLYASVHTDGYPWGYFIGLLGLIGGGGR